MRYPPAPMYSRGSGRWPAAVGFGTPNPRPHRNSVYSVFLAFLGRSANELTSSDLHRPRSPSTWVPSSLSLGPPRDSTTPRARLVSRGSSLNPPPKNCFQPKSPHALLHDPRQKLPAHTAPGTTPCQFQANPVDHIPIFLPSRNEKPWMHRKNVIHSQSPPSG